MGKICQKGGRGKCAQGAGIKLEGPDRSKSKQRARAWVNSAIARRRSLRQPAGNCGVSTWLSARTCFIAFILAINLLCGYLFYHNMFSADPDYTSLYAKPGDFKRAERFVASFLRGNFTDSAYFKPEVSGVMPEKAVKLLGKFRGVSAVSVVVSDREDNGIVLKATCRKGDDTAVIYLTPARRSFHVSGIEIENKYAMKL